MKKTSLKYIEQFKLKLKAFYRAAKKEKNTFITSTVGTLLLCFGIMALTIPYRFADTGVSGLAILSNYVWGISPSWLIIIINIFLLAWGCRILNLRLVLWTIYVLALTTFGLEFFGSFDYPILEETLLAALLGGVLKGLGLGLVFRDGSSTGGIDIITIALNKRYGLDIGMYNFYINIFILMAGYLVVGLNATLYGAVSLYVSGIVIDNVLRSFDRRKQLFIITSMVVETRDFIMKELNKGATVLQGQGAYSNGDRPVILTVLTRRQTVDVKRFLAEHDPKAFIIVGEAAEVVGKGFKSHNEI